MRRGFTFDVGVGRIKGDVLRAEGSNRLQHRRRASARVLVQVQAQPAPRVLHLLILTHRLVPSSRTRMDSACAGRLSTPASVMAAGAIARNPSSVRVCTEVTFT